MNDRTCGSRRHFLASSSFSLGTLGLASLLARDGLLAATEDPAKPTFEPREFDLKPKAPHFQPRADAMISVFSGGGPSHVDLFDPKPTLTKNDGKLYPGGEIKFFNAAGASRVLMGSPFKFTKHGQSGIEMSELIPHMGEIADDICLIRSMNLAGLQNHLAGMKGLTSGRGVPGRPTLGSWLTYGLGSETQDLPAYVALVLRQNPPGSPYWGNGVLPSLYQGTYVRDQKPRIMNLDPPPHLKGAPQDKQLSLLEQLNRSHLAEHAGETDLQARIAGYELAARMQLAAREALDLARETQAVRDLYGLDDPITRPLGEACLIARRLVERGVRFVQIFDYAWDMHQNIVADLKTKCPTSDRPSAALVKDLKARGMLETTLVHWGGEMGRLPVVQGRSKTPGRDHNSDGFSMWLAGGGVKRGHVHGATDEFGLTAVEGVMHHTDFLATVLHLFGLDANKLTFKRNARDETILDGQEGRVMKEILA